MSLNERDDDFQEEYEYEDISLNINHYVNLESDEPDNVIQEVSADIILGDQKVGFIEGSYIDISLLHTDYQNGSIFDVFDAHSQTLANVYPYIMDDNYGVREGLTEGFSDNVLYIDRFVIENEALRNRGIGSRALAYFIRVAGRDAGIVVAQPVPIDKDNKSSYTETDSPDKKERLRRLMKFYKRLGFKKIAKSPYVYLDTAYNIELPNGKRV